jgi:hypothetical protein
MNWKKSKAVKRKLRAMLKVNSNSYLIGQTELYLECNGEELEGLHCKDDGTEGVANGSVVLF